MTAYFATMTNRQSGCCAHSAAAGTSVRTRIMIMDTAMFAVSIIILPIISLISLLIMRP